MEEFSDYEESIIEKTPETKKHRTLTLKSKVHSNLPQNSKNKVANDSGLLKALVEEFENNVTRNSNLETLTLTDESQCLSVDLKKNSAVIDSNMCRKPFGSITEPMQKPFSKNSHKMYVFYLIEEILKFSPNHFPKNSHIHIIGIFDYCDDSKSIILQSMEQTYFESPQIKLDFAEFQAKPFPGDTLSVFGTLSFEKQIPIVVVKFFQQFTVMYSNYVKLMLRLRTTVPLENFEMVSRSDNGSLLADDSLDQEVAMSEDFFNNLTQELDRKPEPNAQPTDSTLYAFLDEISFEKL